jgi:transposase InsO family protein
MGSLVNGECLGPEEQRSLDGISPTMTTAMVLDALEQAIWTRQREGRDDFTALVAHTDHGSQYTSIRYSERIATAGITPSVGAVGSSYDNALAETINGLYKTEVIRHLGPWHNADQVEHATAEWVDWFNTSRLFEYCGDIPRRAGELTLRSQAAANGGRVVKQPRPRTCRGDSHRGTGLWRIGREVQPAVSRSPPARNLP